MATFYLDFEGGNDANDGTTFANRWKTITTGASAARTAPGDTIRVMGSPAPTSLGQNGVWTSGALQATKSISSSTNATPIAITCTAHGYSTGDTVVVTGHTTNTNANGTWEITNTGANTFTLDNSVGNGVGGGSGTVRLRNNTRVTLTTAVTQNIASTGPGRAAWTSAGGANVVTSLSTTTKEHTDGDSIAIQSAFTTGLAAYWPTGTIDLSGYQQVSFWIRQNSGTIGAAAAVDLRLCSDAAGVTAVNTINIPNLGVINRWMPVTVDLATNLGSSIQSIALYVNTDNGAQTFLLSNIIACKASSAADSLTLTSLIGKNTTGETFWGIQSINGTRVMLDFETNSQPTTTTVRGYYGTSETVTTHKRETIKFDVPGNNSSAAIQTINEDGSIADGRIVYSGGWDRTNMSTQSLETWLDGQNGNGAMIALTGRSFITIEKFAVVRANYASSTSSVSRDIILDFVAANNNSSFAFDIVNNLFSTVKFDHCVACTGAVRTNTPFCTIIIGYGIFSMGDTAFSFGVGKHYISAKSSPYKVANCGNTTSAIVTGGYTNMQDAQCIDNAGASVLNNARTDTFLKNCLLVDNTEVSNPTFSNSYLFSQDHDQTAGNHKIFLDGGLISSATDQRNTASGISWKMQPTSTSSRYDAWPVVLSLAKVACAANSLVTVKAWMRRDNTDLTMRLVCKGGQIAGVTTDQVSAMTAGADTWAEQTITFTPTEVGVVEITAEAYGGTTFSGWVDDMTISQA